MHNATGADRAAFHKSCDMRFRFSLLRHSDGSALIEFAIVLGLIILSAVAAMLLLGAQSEQTFAILSTWDGNAPRAIVQQPAAEVADDGGLDEIVSADESVGSMRLITIDFRSLTAVFAAAAITCYLIVRGRGRKKQKELGQLDEDRQLLDRIDNKRFLKRQEIFKVLSGDPLSLLENRLEVRHLMTTRIKTVRPKTTVTQIKAIMDEEQVGHFPVVTDKGRLVGIASGRDLLACDTRTAADIMSRCLITVSPTAKIGFALSQMISRNIACLPVMDEDKLVGLLTTTDAVLTLQCALQLWQRNAKGRVGELHSALA